jgi:hypothetical protein
VFIVFIILEIYSQRKYGKALEDIEKGKKFRERVNAK